MHYAVYPLIKNILAIAICFHLHLLCSDYIILLFILTCFKLLHYTFFSVFHFFKKKKRYSHDLHILTGLTPNPLSVCSPKSPHRASSVWTPDFCLSAGTVWDTPLDTRGLSVCPPACPSPSTAFSHCLETTDWKTQRGKYWLKVQRIYRKSTLYFSMDDLSLSLIKLCDAMPSFVHVLLTWVCQWAWPSSLPDTVWSWSAEWKH